MNTIAILVYCIIDITFLCSVLLCADIIENKEQKPSIHKTIFCFVIFLAYCAMFYKLYFIIELFPLKLVMLLIFYLQFPGISFILSKTTFLKSAFITFLLAQTCDIMQLLIFNILSVFILFDNETYSYFLTNITRFILLVTFIYLKRIKIAHKINTVLQLLPKRIYIFISINILSMGALISLIDHRTNDTILRNLLTNSILLIMFLISFIITFLLISNCISKTYYNSVNSILEKQIKNQIEHYNQTEMLNSDLRRFKHDYTNHMLCLKAMISSNQNSEALKYIEKINSEISLSAKAFNTGHKIADAILNEKHRIHSDMHIKFEGCIPDFIDNVDLCIVLGNAIDNAVEACEKLNGVDKIIDMTVNYVQSHFILIIKNPVAKDYIINGNFPGTTKEDSIKHGFGLSNIKRIVDKYDGDMSIEAGNGIFTLYLALKVN